MVNDAQILGILPTLTKGVLSQPSCNHLIIALSL